MTQLFDIFNHKELDLITKMLEKLPDAVENGNYTNGFREQDVIYQMINKVAVSKISQVTGTEIKVHVGKYLKETNPYDVHTDYFRGDDNPGMAYLVPLAVLPSWDHPTHTVVFNEECRDSLAEYVKTNNKLTNNARDIYDSYCSHCVPEQLEYVTLSGIYKWTPGSVIIWNRKQLHSSDNFIKNGVTEKRALVLFCSEVN